jgi:hypothetical protein
LLPIDKIYAVGYSKASIHTRYRSFHRFIVNGKYRNGLKTKNPTGTVLLLLKSKQRAILPYVRTHNSLKSLIISLKSLIISLKPLTNEKTESILLSQEIVISSKAASQKYVNSCKKIDLET